MSQHMKVQTTGEFSDISVRVPAVHAAKVCAVIENVLALITGNEEAEEEEG